MTEGKVYLALYKGKKTAGHLKRSWLDYQIG
ncbi:hypothetical protein CGSHiII_00714 [Haemophilus influenzae PittII]|nr:hypothetical protein CGSHiII_00714 [Haemophilus influenzae PittII]